MWEQIGGRWVVGPSGLGGCVVGPSGLGGCVVGPSGAGWEHCRTKWEVDGLQYQVGAGILGLDGRWEEQVGGFYEQVGDGEILGTSGI